MSEAARRIGELVVRIQNHFFERPGLKLTPAQVQARLDLDEATCNAVLGTLADASVLARTRDGGYVRFVPGARVGSVRRSASRQHRRVSTIRDGIAGSPGEAA